MPKKAGSTVVAITLMLSMDSHRLTLQAVGRGGRHKNMQVGRGPAVSQ
jgi:hypothetical protein